MLSNIRVCVFINDPFRDHNTNIELFRNLTVYKQNLYLY